MKRKYNRIWSLILAGILTFSGALPASAASVQELPLAANTSADLTGEASSGIAAEFLYAELFEDGATQGVIVKLGTEQTLQSAVLHSRTADGTEHTSAAQIIENYAAFQLPASDDRTFLTLDFTLADGTYTTDLTPLEQGSTLDEEDFQNAVPEAAAYSPDAEAKEQKAVFENNVITTTLDEEISSEAFASSLTTTAPSARTRTGTSETPEEPAIPENPEEPEKTKKIIVLDPGHGGPGTGTYRDWGDFIIDEATINFKISNYTKDALEANYADIEVYLTKVKPNENPKLEARVKFAVEKKADLLISQHVNATGEPVTSAHGVLAMVPKLDGNHSYHEDAAKNTQEVARLILDELVKLGFNDMGFQFRLSESKVPDRYEDGSIADYYGIVRYSRIYNMPGTIIEHGFANNREDALKLNNEAMLKRMGEADARGIAAYLQLSSGTSTPPEYNTPDQTPKNAWVESDGKWYYYDADGAAVTGWLQLNNTWYYLDPTGVMQTGWLQLDNKKYYLKSSGAMHTGWLLLGDTWYYLNTSGAMLTGFQTINGKTYYFDESGKMLTGWQTIDNKKYYFDANGALDSSKTETPETPATPSTNKWISSNGRWWYRHADGSYTKSNWEKIGGVWYYFDAAGWMTTGWQKVDGNWYYMNASGKMLTGWQLIKGKWYYLNTSGKMLTGWQKIGNYWYYMNASGAMLTGWQWINGKCYYLNTSGAMASNTWIGSYFVDSSGAWVQNKTPQSSSAKWILSGGRWWYRHADGSYTKSDWEKINGKWYLFDNSGWMLTGWQKVNGIWYYMDGSGKMLTGWQKINNLWYYMNTSGKMLTGWQTINNKTYYLDESGKMLTGTQEIDGITYTFDGNGALASDKTA